MTTSEEQYYFQSPDTTAVSSKTGGASLYAAYMSDIHARRLRKAQAPPPPDAAGLIAGSKFHGRDTPQKGKGVAPIDNKHQGWVSSRAAVAGNGKQGLSSLLMHEEADDTLARRPHTSHGARPLARLADQSFKSHLKGAAMAVSYEDPAKHKCKNLGAFVPTVDTSRIFAGSRPDAVIRGDMGDKAPRSKIRSWEVQLAEADRRRQVEEQERPQTAPGKLTRGMTAARKHYHAALHDSNQDVYRYRYSGGICPDEYKFAEVRQSYPALQVKPTGSPKEVFYDSRTSYSSNRVKGLQSSIFS